MTERPSLESLVGDELDPLERERLGHVHDLLLEVGPPPELPGTLDAPPSVPDAEVVPLHRRRYRFTALAAAAVVALSLLGVGYAVGLARDDGPTAAFDVAMNGPGATATIAVFDADDAGNWPMELSVTGLDPLPKGRSYELWLTRDGELAERCGTFRVAEGTTRVPLNAPYRIDDYSGWVVVETGSDDVLLRTATV